MPRLVEHFKNQVKETNNGEEKVQTLQESRFNLREALTTPDASIIMPRVISDVMRDAAEPMYIGSKLLKKVQLTEGRSIEFPSMSAIRAHDVGEIQEFPEETPDFQRHETTEIRVGKVGLRVAVSEEMLNDSQWDVIGILLQKAGQAMARHKEEKIFNEFSSHGHVIFDNEATDPALQPTGYGPDATPNGTLSVEDMVDMVIELMSKGYTATDVLMHPLTWTMMAKNEFLSVLPKSALGSETPNDVSLDPSATNGRLPFPINLNFSPFIPFNRADKTFDMYVVDRNNIGILLVKDELQTDQWNNPTRDIMNIKVKERYGIGILDSGNAISLAKNIAFAKSYGYPEQMITIDSSTLNT